MMEIIAENGVRLGELVQENWNGKRIVLFVTNKKLTSYMLEQALLQMKRVEDERD